MASDCSDDNVFAFPPLVQNMKLSTNGGPVYRGSRGGRAAAAYYREKEIIIAIKNKYGRRFGRRIQPFKPDTELWRPERYQRHTDTPNSHTSVVIPGGLQNKKPLIHICHDSLAQTAGRVDRQEQFSQRNLIKSSETIKSEKAPATSRRTSESVDLADLGRPSRQGRGVMRGKRVVDLSAIYGADENEEVLVNCIANTEKRLPEANIQKHQDDVTKHDSNRSPSKLNDSEKEECTASGINTEKGEPRSCIQEVQENMINHESNEPPSELVKSEKEECTASGINTEKGEPKSCIQEVQENMISHESNEPPSELIKSEELAVNDITNSEKEEAESCSQEAHENMLNQKSNESPSDLVKSVENLSIL